MKLWQLGGRLGAFVALALAAPSLSPSLSGEEPPYHCPFNADRLAEEGTSIEAMRRPKNAGAREASNIRYSHTSELSPEDLKTPLKSPHQEQRQGESGMTIWEIVQLVVISFSAIVVTWYAYRKVG